MEWIFVVCEIPKVNYWHLVSGSATMEGRKLEAKVA